MTDLDIIKQIEKELNVKLIKVDDIGFGGGYSLNQNGQVTGISLFGCRIKKLNRIISLLKELRNLGELQLTANQLSDISPLKALMNLTELNLGGNQLSDISPLKELLNLKKLGLSYNRISDISPLKTLTNLNLLDLRDNQLSDISPLKALTNLTELCLSNNQISDISPLKAVSKLTILDLSANHLSNIHPLNALSDLTILDLTKNPIKELPSWIVDLKMDFKWEHAFFDDIGILLGENPLKIPPVEIVKQGKEAVKNYFEQLEKQGKDNIYEAKLMLVGEPGSGKTTLMNLLFDKDFPVPNKKQKSTLGIEVRQNWGFSIDDARDFKAHIWDFGGQQI
ncbi:leucine-rich repeat domain-containing protein, partial [candidate division KSB1 bacterium]|nr:leucine-rich repeat domain-containing protein [candidate division KSB1 bacterium]